MRRFLAQVSGPHEGSGPIGAPDPGGDVFDSGWPLPTRGRSYKGRSSPSAFLFLRLSPALASLLRHLHDPNPAARTPHPRLRPHDVNPKDLSGPALLPAPAGSFRKGGVLHFQRPSPRGARGKKKLLRWPSRGMWPREIHRPKSGPSFTSPLTPGSNCTSPIPQRGKARQGGGRSPALSEPFFLLHGRDGFRRGEGCSGVVEKVIGSWRGGEGG